MLFKTEFIHDSGNEKLILLSDTLEEAKLKRPKFMGFNLLKIREVFWGPKSEFENEQLRGL